MSSGKWRPFCLGLNVLTAMDKRILAFQVLWFWLALSQWTKRGSANTYFNPVRAKVFRENINIYLHFVSYLHIDTTQVVEIFPQTYLFYIVNIMAADVLAT